MNKIKILVDSGSDISKKICKKYDIDIVPLNVIYEGKSLKDVFEINPVDYCEYLKTCPEIPTSSQPSPMEFLDYYKKYMNDYEHIICITMAPAGSGTYNSACLAKEMFAEEHSNCQIHVIDSKSCGLAETFQAKIAAEMIENNADIYDILAKLEKIRFNVGTYYLVDNIEFLIKGGRVSTLKGAIATKLKLKPIVTIRLGNGSNLCNALGHFNGINKLANFYLADGDTNETLYISHANCKDNAIELAEKIKHSVPNLKCEILQMNCVMATQSGPDSIGMFYIKK